jgi:glycosyltransferase involved in cell wall biosynthesis
MSSPASQPTRDHAVVSVALCTHNGERFIVEQLESIFAQTIAPDEIVLSDDASTDRTVEVAREAVDRLVAETGISPALTVIANARALGVTANFEQAISACAGDIILLSDQDDRWDPSRLKRSLEAFAGREDLLLVHSDARLVDETGRSFGLTLFDALEIGPHEVLAIRAGKAFELLLRRNLVTGATTAIRADLARAAAPFPSAWLHDEWLAIVASAIGAMDVLDAPLIDYRQHGTNQIGARKLWVVGKIGRMREPGGTRNARLLARATALAERFSSMGTEISPCKLELVRSKLAHETVRSSLPINRVRRLPAVFAELRTGRYRSFGRGTADAVRDLIQPHRDAR